MKEYKTECPLFESEKFSSVVAHANLNSEKPKLIYSLNLNTYDAGVKQYYPSMDPNSMGGELKYKAKKKIKAIAKEQEKKANNLGTLLQAYDDIEA